MALAIRCEEFGVALNALVCVVSYAVRNMPANAKLLRECISRFDEISRRLCTGTDAGETRAGAGVDTGTDSNEDVSRTPIQITPLVPPVLHCQPNFVLKYSADILFSSGKVNTLSLSPQCATGPSSTMYFVNLDAVDCSR
jgi:hypothetical protein